MCTVGLKKILNKKLKNIWQKEFINKSDLFRQNLITQCIHLFKHCVLSLLSENIWNWKIIFTFNLIIFISLITIAFCAYWNSHLNKLWRRRMNMGVGELWKSHPIGPEGWLGDGRERGGGESNSSKITSHNLQAASYLPSSLCWQSRSLNKQTLCLICGPIMAFMAVKNKSNTFDPNQIKTVNVGRKKNV